MKTKRTKDFMSTIGFPTFPGIWGCVTDKLDPGARPVDNLCLRVNGTEIVLNWLTG